MGARITGQCWCGATRFAFRDKPLMVRACWCRDCQYVACGNASINAIFKAEGLEMSGEPLARHESRADSGNSMVRSFCKSCGTHLFSTSDARPHLVVVRVGALDDREIGGPSAAIWTASKPSWGHVDCTIDNFPGQSPPVPGPR